MTERSDNEVITLADYRVAAGGVDTSVSEFKDPVQKILTSTETEISEEAEEVLATDLYDRAIMPIFYGRCFRLLMSHWKISASQ